MATWHGMAGSNLVRIERLAPEGDGAAMVDGHVHYVPFALPGETWRAPAADGDCWQLVTASAERQTPPCPHFTRCGGCSAQHMGDELYLAWKRDAVVRAFAAQGLAPAIARLAPVASGTRRRAVLTARQVGAEIVLGYHEPGTHALVDLGACPVLDPDIVRAFPSLRALARVLLGPKIDVRITVLRVDAGLDVHLETGKANLGGPLRLALADAVRGTSVLRLAVDGEVIVQPAPVRISLGGIAVEPPPGVFVQAVPSAEAQMIALVSEAVAGARRVADLFAGIGTFTFALARKAQLLAVDSELRALTALAAAARGASGLKPIETRVRDLFREPLARKELEPFDAVVLDPPRAGAKAQSAMLAKATVAKVVMVSCNPSTLARDVRTLVDGGYALSRVVSIDQFLWSRHVEIVAVLDRR